MKRAFSLDDTASGANITKRTLQREIAKGTGPVNPLAIVGEVARAALVPARGHVFLDADFSGIESRVTAWLAGEQSKLDQWAKFDKTGLPEDEPYFINGSRFGFSPDRARAPGKVADLAFGFAGGAGAYRKTPGADPDTPNADVEGYKDAWRLAHPAIVKFWSNIWNAALEAVLHPGKVFEVNSRISWRCDDDSAFLRMRLPSQRELAYPSPSLINDDQGYLILVHKDNEAGKWVDVTHFGRPGTWKGKIVENAVQAVARDLFASAMPRLEAAGYHVVLHLHDEILVEAPEGFGSKTNSAGAVDEFKRIITEVPMWASGLPIAAKGDVRERFCKIKPRERHGPEPEIPAKSMNICDATDYTQKADREPDYTPGGADNTTDYTMNENAIEQFCAAIAAAGLTPPDEVIADSELHRFASDGRPDDDAGWYVFRADGVPSGVFGCWRAGVKINWQANTGRELTAAEIAAANRLIAEAGQKRAEAEKKNRELARVRAAHIWDHAAAAPADHPYLTRKGVKPHGLRISGDELIVPMRDAVGVLHSLQFIDAEGGKRFLRDGRKRGCFHILGKPNGELCIAEGFATAATILEDTNRAVAVCFDAGNLPVAARDLSAKFPGMCFIVCADDDAGVSGNPGRTKAFEAAAILGGGVAVPDFGPDRPTEATDFNDLHQHAGAVSVRAGVDRAAKVIPDWKFKIVPFGEISLDTTPAYLVKDLLPRIGLAVFWGPPKCGKSFFVFDLLMHVALGWKFRDLKVKQGAVVYCALEGAAGFKKRKEAFRCRKLEGHTGEVPFWLLASPMALVTDLPALLSAIRGQCPVPAAVVIDTLNRSLEGSESSDEDMGNYIKAADAIREAFGCVVIIVHHCGYDATHPRGHTSLAGAVDMQAAVTRDAENNVIAVVEYLKDGRDGPEGAKLISRLEVVSLGLDDDGDEITSCIVVPVIPAEGAASGTPRAWGKDAKPPKGNAKIAHEALFEVIGSSKGVVPPTHPSIPPGRKCAKIPEWMLQAASRGLCSGGSWKAREEAFRRASVSLVAAHLVGCGKNMPGSSRQDDFIVLNLSRCF